jgi:hypothetical protein
MICSSKQALSLVFMSISLLGAHTYYAVSLNEEVQHLE